VVSVKKDMNAVLDAFEGYIKPMGRTYDAWWIAVTSDVMKSLDGHGVLSDDSCIHREVDSPSAARNVRRFFVAQGMDGNLDQYAPGDSFVYAYLKAGHTKP